MRYSHVTTSEATTFDTLITPRLRYVLKGIRRTCTLTHQPRERLPITFHVMKRLHTVFSKHPTSYKDVMNWAACCLAYFGLLRVSEFTTASPDFFNHSTDLLLSDVALYSRTSPTMVQITLKQCKNDRFQVGNQVCLDKTSHAICPVKALVQYLTIRGSTPGPLFLLPNKQALTRIYFSKVLDKAFGDLHMSPHQFNTHSF